jgi:hypothetical protein
MLAAVHHLGTRNMPVNVSKKIEDMEVDRAMKLEQLRHELKRDARPLRDHIRHALQNGCNAAYLACRYGLSVEDVEKAKRIWGL